MNHESQRPDPLRALLERRDLTDPAQGPHPMQALVRRLDGLPADAPRRTLRTPPLVPAREGWQPRHSTTETVRAALPDLLADGTTTGVVVCAGLVHGYAEPDATRLLAHELDLWHLGASDSPALAAVVQGTVGAGLPGVPYRLLPGAAGAAGPDFRVQVSAGDAGWQDVGRCGVLRHGGAAVAVGVSLVLEPLLAVSGLLERDHASGNTATVTSSRSW